MVSCVWASSNVLVLEVWNVAHTRVPLSAVPRYSNLVGSKRVWTCASSSGPMMAPGNTVAMVVPSLGAALNMNSAALLEPAPGMFCTMIDGLPLMYLPMWRAMARA